MTEARLLQLRREVRGGELPEDLLEELRGIVQRLVGLRLLPPSFAPYGRWDDEATSEIFNGWYTERLLGRGHLLALLDQAASVGGFRRLCERSLRQHLINAQDRSQSHNLYRRLRAMLESDDSFVMTRDAARPQDRWYFLAGGDGPPREFSGDEGALLAHGWAVGDLAIIRYAAGARKLSPVLDGGELKRFVRGLLAGAGCALSPALIMRVLSTRLDLEPVRVEQLEDDQSGQAPAAATHGPHEQLSLRETALVLLSELSPRQAEVLKLTADGYTVAQVAESSGCSTGTVVNEQRRVGALISRLSENDRERDELLNVLADLVYMASNE
jgi:DNA-binding CsgD family transcriptional regulator